MFYLLFEENKENFLKSWERMVQATYPDFKFDENVFNLPSEEIDTEKLTQGIYDGSIVNTMVLAKKYLQTINLKKYEDYPPESIESQLCVIRDYYDRLQKNPETMYSKEMIIGYNYLFSDGKIPDEWKG